MKNSREEYSGRKYRQVAVEWWQCKVGRWQETVQAGSLTVAVGELQCAGGSGGSRWQAVQTERQVVCSDGSVCRYAGGTVPSQSTGRW